MRDEEQALAVTVGLLLLIGGVLMARELLGVWVAFGLGSGAVVGGYCLPWVIRWVTIRRAVRQLRRYR
ncbi:hypothetical protein BKD26_38700 [Streptomyces sp. CB03238]|nr:hypothetical protein BKD26_38700 [Streptomyces sp. CB03238]